MRLTESQREKLGMGAEELKSLGHLVEEITSRNPSSCGEELLAINKASAVGVVDNALDAGANGHE